MATDQDFADYVAEQMALGDRLSRKPMFGEYAFYVDGKVVGFACDNSFFLKPSAAGEAFVPALPRKPPYPGAKDYLMADELLDDSERLQYLVLETAALMPVPRPRKSATARKSGK